ncbi:MAG: hypothetical protein ABIP51_16710 [Bacteroidia bacterium]
MKAKLLIVGLISEQLVATFKTPSEAFHCGSLLQASTEDKNLIYYVEYKKKREKVDSFLQRLPFLNKQTQLILKTHYNSN